MAPVLTPAAGLLRSRWRRRIVGRAADRAATLSGMRLLVLAPHPDDETFGCGALIARAAAAGQPVTVVVATDGARSATSDTLGPEDLVALRRTELRAACERLGVTELVELGYRDGTLDDRGTALAADVAAAVARHRPEAVLVPCAQDHHPDHRALHVAAVAAVRGSPRPPLLLAYPVWAWHAAPLFLGTGNRRALPGLWLWAARQYASVRWWRVPTDGHLERKRAAVAAYASQISNYTGEPGWSFLPPSFVAAFLGGDEVFLPVDVAGSH